MLYICTKFHENIPSSGGALIKDEKMVGGFKAFSTVFSYFGSIRFGGNASKGEMIRRF